MRAGEVAAVEAPNKHICSMFPNTGLAVQVADPAQAETT